MSKTTTIISVVIAFWITHPVLWAVTIVQGDVSGDWHSTGNPYNVIATARVPPGQVLRIHPGVVVAVDPAAALEIDRGQIVAMGSNESPIVFESLVENTLWSGISILGHQESPPTSVFEFCEFHGAQTAVSIVVVGHVSHINEETIMASRISNCYFASTVGRGVYGEACARDASQFMTPRRLHARLEAMVERCVFDGVKQGIRLQSVGGCNSWCFGAWIEATIHNCVFLEIQPGDGLGGAAFTFSGENNEQSSGTAQFTHNTVHDCARGVFTAQRFNTTTRNSLFVGNGTAVEREGTSNSGTVEYNCFFNNVTDFVGYPAGYGRICCTNDNGDPADAALNTFGDPLLHVDGYHLTNSSLCIDAGRIGVNVADDIDGQSRPQSVRPDIGADEFVTMDMTLPSDCNQDSRRDISDAICLFGHLFLGKPSQLPCGDGSATDSANKSLLDHNGDVRVDISDGIGLLNFLFETGSPPASGADCLEIPGCSMQCGRS